MNGFQTWVCNNAPEHEYPGLGWRVGKWSRWSSGSDLLTCSQLALLLFRLLKRLNRSLGETEVAAGHRSGQFDCASSMRYR